MASTPDVIQSHKGIDALTPDVGRSLSRPTKSRPFWPPRTPRWLLRCFDACDANVAVEGGVFELNHVADMTFDESAADRSADFELRSATLSAAYGVSSQAPRRPGTRLPSSVALYETHTVELETIQTIVRSDTSVPALYSDTHDQLQWQLKMAAEFIHETKENLAYNHPTYGLLNSVAPSMEFDAGGPPTPDVLDELLGLAWKRPDCFCMNPEALAAFHKAANAQSLNLESIQCFGASFTAWRGVPICPTDKLQLVSEADGKPRRGISQAWLPAPGDEAERPRAAREPGTASTDVLLARLGYDNHGVVNLYAAGVKDRPDMPGISVDFMGRRDDSVESYLLSTYAAVAVISPGALARARVVL